MIPGVQWADSIVRAITECRLMVLVFSSDTNDSDHIVREVELAAHHRRPIIPQRDEADLPSPTLDDYIAGTHWLDAIDPPLEAHLSLSTVVGAARPPPEVPTERRASWRSRPMDRGSRSRVAGVAVWHRRGASAPLRRCRRLLGSTMMPGAGPPWYRRARRRDPRGGHPRARRDDVAAARGRRLGGHGRGRPSAPDRLGDDPPPTPTPTTPPRETAVKAPMNVHPTSVASTAVVLEWKAAPHGTSVDHFIVVRNGKPISGELSRARFVDDGVVPGATYVYRVIAVGTDGTEARSVTTEEITVPVPPPAAPPPETSGPPASSCDGIVTPSGECIPWNA
jgi:hypothetical protein